MDADTGVDVVLADTGVNGVIVDGADADPGMDALDGLDDADTGVDAVDVDNPLVSKYSAVRSIAEHRPSSPSITRGACQPPQDYGDPVQPCGTHQYRPNPLKKFFRPWLRSGK
eukprot:EG_transcript_27670